MNARNHAIFWGLMLVGPMGLGCSEPCAGDTPSFELEILTAELETDVRSLEFLVAVGPDQYRRVQDIVRELDDDETSIRIGFERTTTAETLPIEVTVRAFAATQATGALLSQSSERFTSSQDACNWFSVGLKNQRTTCGTTCTLDCQDAETCPVDCTDGARCHIDCQRAGTCEAECFAGATCSIDCRNAEDCSQVNCVEGATCALECAGSPNCGFSFCAGIQRTCEGGILVCNGNCP